METFILMNSFKPFVTILCYFSAGVAFVEEFTEAKIMEHIAPSEGAQEILLWLFIVLWVLKIAWFVYEKFHLERRERILGMDIKREEIQDMRENNKKQDEKS